MFYFQLRCDLKHIPGAFIIFILSNFNRVLITFDKCFGFSVSKVVLFCSDDLCSCQLSFGALGELCSLT